MYKSQSNENKSDKTAVLPLQEDFESHGWAKTTAEHLASDIKHTEYRGVRRISQRGGSKIYINGSAFN